MRAVVPVERDPRLDLFRGLSLWLLFLDQLPSAVVSAFAIRSYGFGDATEIIVFVFGYTAGFVYGPLMGERGFVVATANTLRRAWQVYVAHVFLFVFYIAEIIAEARGLHYPINVLLARRKTAVIPGISSADALALAVRCIRGAGTCGKLRGALCSP